MLQPSREYFNDFFKIGDKELKRYHESHNENKDLNYLYLKVFKILIWNKFTYKQNAPVYMDSVMHEEHIMI